MFHATFTKRINRCVPLIGMLFFTYQAYIKLIDAKEEDRLFIKMMRDMEKEAPENLQGQSYRQEWFIIACTLTGIMFGWGLSLMIIQNFNNVYAIFLLGFFLALFFDYVMGKIALNIYSELENKIREII